MAAAALLASCGRFGYDPLGVRAIGDAGPSGGAAGSRSVSSPASCAATCAEGHADCDGDPSNGCEQSLNDESHCGTCGRVCSAAHGTNACSAGVCVPSCDTGFADCDGNPDNGCEADLNNNPARCGSCSSSCNASTQACVAGRCELSPCSSGRGECDGDSALACETDVQTSIQHCGFCANACSAANGTPVCSAGTCEVQGCAAGFGNCDGAPLNGCETALPSTTAHCGACGRACTNTHGATQCSGAACIPTCNVGFGDCDGSTQNGCETPLDSVEHCNGCGSVCSPNGGTPICSAGACNTLCDLDGTFALKLTGNGTSPETTYTQAGSGTFNYWLRAVAVHGGPTLNVSVTECGRVVPGVDTKLVSETVRVLYPDNLFDGGFLPSSSAAVSLGSSSPGAIVSWPLTTTLMGISLASPSTYDWPADAASIPAGNRVDMDGDGKPGVTTAYANGGGNDYPRTSLSFGGGGRADLAYVAGRLSFSLSGTLASCSASSGSATITRIDKAIFGCNRANSTEDCSTSEGEAIDGAEASWTMGAATYTLQRVANGASCAAVRAALP